MPLAQLEEAIGRLSYDERLWLIERLAHGLRQSTRNSRLSCTAALAQMASDPEIRRELDQIAQEFTPADMDGLEQA
jgi:hypothetical protein